VLVLDLGLLRRYPSTLLKQLERYLDRLEASGSALVLVQVGDEQRRVLERVGVLDRIGADNVLPPDPHLGLAVEQGLRRAEAILAERSGS
jgi:hypothetical protein